MEHLIKPYSCIPGEKIFLKKIFPNFRFCFHHLSHTALQFLLPAYPVIYKNQQDKSFCWFFFVLQPIKYNLK
ncbi:MAG TPA: hypothetical protein DCR40_14790 [Prolixibacteraceae bacterium]|nr:hypothetical protein [Prolixibacteraceae bacterium]